MATFGENHGAGKGLIAPIATHKAMRHMPVGHVFAMFYGNDVA
jgi:hypothetical protein